MSDGFLTRIDLYRSRSGSWSRVFVVSQWRREGRELVNVTPVEWQLSRQGGFPEALLAAQRLAWPGETVRVRVFAWRRGSRGYGWGQVNSYPVQLPRVRGRVGL